MTQLKNKKIVPSSPMRIVNPTPVLTITVLLQTLISPLPKSHAFTWHHRPSQTIRSMTRRAAFPTTALYGKKDKINSNRPSKDDVMRISRGQRSKSRGVGSRLVPHRLNADERKAFDLAVQKGFLVVDGGGYRRERKGSPVRNCYRLWCDAVGRPNVAVFKGGNGDDSVEVDLSPLLCRMSELEEDDNCGDCSGMFESFGKIFIDEIEAEFNVTPSHVPLNTSSSTALSNLNWSTAPIHTLPEYRIVWNVSRNVGKNIAKYINERESAWGAKLGRAESVERVGGKK